ncbi:coproporphyrinogen III oxidase oxygen-independent [Algibacter lectus]|uniref:Coproporphyrinogen III oxidase n=2 Tax=Algibacter TaxID=261827 RepID=A0A090VN21_9FLAO|nr:coproporphyrinogen III oxidase oxygen-independent [Algibacter lectus]GAL81753.1 coproporphyrinogen III oxidase [Algibacter lectus]
MIGLGVSSISDSWYGFAQNVKGLESYYNLLEDNIIPVYRGHILNEEDLVIRQHILNLMCRFKTSWTNDALRFPELPDALIRLKEMEQDGLLKIETDSIAVTDKGQPFVRNICMAFDLLLQRKQPDTQLFSMTV